VEDFDPRRLEHVAGRLADLERLKRRYGGSLDDVIAALAAAREEHAALAGVPERLEALKGEVRRLEQRYMTLARDLSGKRRNAAKDLSQPAAKELEALAMEGTLLEILVDPVEPPEPQPNGIDRIGFWIATNRGEALKPLSKIASGGELSRLMLALRNATEETGDGRTLIFDEVDSGIGGRVADAVGQRLSRLARRHQVLCVTHLPQIAAFADQHYHVRKRTTGARTRATVSMLDEDGRVEEIARMLGGVPPETARRHAAAMVGRRGRTSV
jgi:DNA repair protein RecN (Recombination protein N)